MKPPLTEQVRIVLHATRLSQRILELREEPEFGIDHEKMLAAAYDVFTTGMARADGLSCHVTSATHRVLDRAVTDLEVQILYDKLGLKHFWGTPPLGVVK